MTPLEMLRDLGPGSPPAPQTKQRVYDGLLTALGTAAMGVTQQPLLNGQAGATGVLSGIGSTKAALLGAGLWLFGGAAGAAIYGVLRPAEVRVIYVERPAAVASAATVNEPAHAAPVAPASAVLAPSAARSATRRAPPERAAAAALRARSDLARERALLDVARANAARGEPERVLEEVERHSQQFRDGRLAEEREALAIRALLSLGRKAEAEKRAQAFRAAYPNSFLAPMLDAASSGP